MSKDFEIINEKLEQYDWGTMGIVTMRYSNGKEEEYILREGFTANTPHNSKCIYYNTGIPVLTLLSCLCFTKE